MAETGASARGDSPLEQILANAGELIAAASEYLRAGFPRLRDREDVAQTAYEELLGRARAGKPITDAKASICVLARQRALNLLSDERSETFKATPIDPSGLTLTSIESVEDSAEDRLLRASERAEARAAVAGLPPKLAQIYHARHAEGLSPQEACEKLGLSRSTFYSRSERLYERMSKALSPVGLAKLQLKAYEALQSGKPSRLRDAALEWRRSDPAFAAQCRALDRAHENLALLIPPSLLEAHPRVSIGERIGELAEAVRERLPAFGGGRTETASDAAGALASSGAGRGSGAAAGGALATITGALGAKGVAVCAGGVATAACVAAVVAPGLGPSDEKTGSGPAPAEAAAAEVDRRPPEPPRIPTTELKSAAGLAQGSGASGQPSTAGGGSSDGGGDGDGDATASQPRSAPTPANPSSPSDPDAYNPYSPTSPAPAAPAPAPAPSPSSGDGSSGGGSSGGCNPYDPAC